MDNKTIFDQMIEILEETYRLEHRRGGHPPKLSVLDKFVIMLSYYRNYRTMDSIAFVFWGRSIYYYGFSFT